MAASRLKAQPIGSAAWILEERQQANQFMKQEVEDFTLSARNEMDWLNEHMAEIFDREQFDVAQIFKTPGKLRGKTPRTAGKRNPLETRAPLTDIFAPTPQQPNRSPSHSTPFYKQVAQFKVAEDVEDVHQAVVRPSRYSVGIGKENADSGYHEMTDEETDVDEAPQKTHLSPIKQKQASPPKPHSPTPPHIGNADEPRVSEASFVSAKEALSAIPPMETLDEDGDTTEDDTEVAPVDTGFRVNDAAKDRDQPAETGGASLEANAYANAVPPLSEMIKPVADGSPSLSRPEDDDGLSKQTPPEDDDSQSSSDGSTPQRLLVRKSSLTFASLPARDPLPTKKSMGARASRTSQLDHQRTTAAGRNSQLGGYALGRSLGGAQSMATTDADQNAHNLDVDEERPLINREESETIVLHNKTSTQRLHERITMLGQSQAPRPSKSIPTSFASTAPVYPQLPTTETEALGDHELARSQFSYGKPSGAVGDDDDDWIAPIKSTQTLIGDETQLQLAKRPLKETDKPAQIIGIDRALGHGKEDYVSMEAGLPVKAELGHATSNSVPVLMSTTKPAHLSESLHQKTTSTSHPHLVTAGGVHDSTTPAGTPGPKRYADGPLSASKAKLYSVLKSAKGIFASSAGISAQAKLEVLSQSPSRLNSKESLVSGAYGDLYPDIKKASKNVDRVSSVPEKVDDGYKGRRTRSSTERQHRKREDEAAERQRAVDGLERGKEQPGRVAETQKTQLERSGNQQNAVSGKALDDLTDMPPPPPPKSQLPTAQLQKPRDLRRPVKPTREVLHKTKPAPVSIRVASQRIGQVQPSNTALAASLQDSLAPAPPPKPPSLASTVSSTSLNNACPPNTFKSSNTSTTAKPRALEAAAKKREQDEREAQRKAEQKRELERKRAAKQEEERKAEEQRRAAEQQRQAEVKKTAQKQAAEQRRIEVAKKAEQQRSQALAKAKQANDLSNALQQEGQQSQAQHQRPDLGARAPSRMNTLHDFSRPVPQPPINPAKPPKRAFQADGDDQTVPRSTAQRIAPSFQQNDAKRRRTDEEDWEEPETRPTMAPPIRLSHIRKDIATKLQHGYMAAPAQGHGAPSMLKAAISTQHSMSQLKTAHPNDMAKFSNAKIPFAEVSNPPQSSLHKTPASSSQQQQQPVAKSSPSYPQGDNISLPEIATDSEDEDEDSGFRAPSWADSPALRELLSQQQLVDPQSVFGPIAPLQMEEMFKGNPEKLKKFRQRTSSAVWDRGDRVTEEEKRRDMEARERLEREGGWRFVPGGS